MSEERKCKIFLQNSASFPICPVFPVFPAFPSFPGFPKKNGYDFGFESNFQMVPICSWIIAKPLKCSYSLKNKWISTDFLEETCTQVNYFCVWVEEIIVIVKKIKALTDYIFEGLQ
jgi:hypothetical protein